MMVKGPEEPTHPRHVEVAGYRGNVDDSAFSLDDKRGERLSYGQRAPEVDVKDTFKFIDGGVQYG